MKVVNLDRSGNVIPDMSKVVWPEDISRKAWETMNPGKKARREVCHGKPQG